MKGRMRGLIYRAWRKLYESQDRSDLGLLLANPHFIPKRLLRDALKRAAISLEAGIVLDVGCGNKPYRALFPGCRRYIGFDYSVERKPDFVSVAEAVPLPNAIIDVVLCTEVIEQTREPHAVISRDVQAFEAGGMLLLSAPMSCNLHYEPHDYYRFTCYGLEYRLKRAGFTVVKTQRLGGLVSLIGARMADVIQ